VKQMILKWKRPTMISSSFIRPMYMPYCEAKTSWGYDNYPKHRRFASSW
jgi:hypothetical protein